MIQTARPQLQAAVQQVDPGAPRVSVLMPLLNPHAVYFPQAVESILAQTFSDLELIVVEDPSNQSGSDLLAKFADPRIRHARNSRRTSLPEQRNCTLDLARAEFIAFLDADDVAEPNRIEAQFRFLQDNPDVDVVGSNLRIIDSSGYARGYRAYPEDHAAIVAAMRRFNPLAQPSVMCRKAPVLAAGGFHGEWQLALDYDLWCRLARRGARFANLTESLVRYRIHPEASKSAQLRRTIRETLDIKERHWGDSMGLSGRIRAAGERLLLRLPPRFVLRLFMMVQYRSQPPRIATRRPVVTASKQP